VVKSTTVLPYGSSQLSLTPVPQILAPWLRCRENRNAQKSQSRSYRSLLFLIMLVLWGGVKQWGRRDCWFLMEDYVLKTSKPLYASLLPRVVVLE